MNRNEILRSVGLIKHTKNDTNFYTINNNNNINNVASNTESEDGQKNILKLAKKFVLQIPLTVWYKRQQMDMIQLIFKRRMPKPKPGIII